MSGSKKSKEQFHEMFARHSAIMLLVRSDDGKILNANAAAEKFYGYPHEIFCEMNISDIDKTQQKEIKEWLSDAANEKRSYFIFQHLISNGEVRNVEVNSSPIISGGDKALFLIIHNITELSRAFESIRKSEERYRIISENSGDVIWIIDIASMKFTYVSPAVANLIGYAAEEVMQKDIELVLSSDSYKRISDLLPKRLRAFMEGDKNARTWINELDQIHKDGSVVITEVITTFLTDSNGRPIEILGVTRDITERKKNQTAILKAKDQAEAANAAKSNFLANISHELRTPMNGIIGFSHLLSLGSLSEVQIQYNEMIKTSSEHLLELINDILDFSKLEARKLKLYKKDFDLKTVIDNVIELVNAQSKKKKLSISFLMDGEIKYMITGDQLRLKQIIINLLSNAIKFTQAGSIEIRAIQESISDKIANITISVSDTGIGIPPERLDEIFEAFSQIDDSTTKRQGGAGLGLSIVKGLVEMMNGKISVKSEIGRGSTFKVEIPFEICNEALPAISNPKAAFEKQNEINKVNILLAEDDEMSCAFITAFSNFFNWDITLAKTGIEAVEKFKAGKFDIIFMDAQIPEMNGFEVSSIIREMERKTGGHIPIIAIMAYTPGGDHEKFIKSGMDDYMTKPITDEMAMLNVVNRYVNFA